MRSSWSVSRWVLELVARLHSYAAGRQGCSFQKLGPLGAKLGPT